MDITLSFLRFFLLGTYYFAPLLLVLVMAVVVVGQVVGRMESWSRFDALYWSFITATTVGYGDIRPRRRRSKSLSVLIAFVGLIFTGIVVAIAVTSASMAFTRHVDVGSLEKRIERID